MKFEFKSVEYFFCFVRIILIYFTCTSFYAFSALDCMVLGGGVIGFYKNRRRKYISATAEIVLYDEDKCVIIYYCDER